MNPESIIRNYLCNLISSAEFQQEIYNNKELELFLSVDVYIPPYTTNHANPFYYLLESNVLTPSGEVNCKDLLVRFCTLNKIDYTLDDKHLEINAMLLKITPSWLSISQEYFAKLLVKHKEKSGKELESALKKDISSEFKFLNKKPKWLQETHWPIEDNKPLIFLGQLDITALKHDISFVYVFFNEDNKSYLTIEQSI
jgi:hypothetical protein